MNGRNGPKKKKEKKTRNIILFVPGVELEYHFLQISYFRLPSWIFEECYKYKTEKRQISYMEPLIIYMIPKIFLLK